MMRPLGLLVATSIIMAQVMPAQAQDNRAAYNVAVRCFVANVRAENVERRAGQLTSAERYKVVGKQAFDAAATLGVALGRNTTQIEADIGQSRTNDLPRMVREADYYRQVVATCRAYGLMPAA